MYYKGDLKIDRFALARSRDAEGVINNEKRKVLCDLGAKIGENIPFNKLTMPDPTDNYTIEAIVIDKKKWDQIYKEIAAYANERGMNDYDKKNLKTFFIRLMNS